jgi:tetratricopeptide (TPR) repeat protein
VTTEVKPLEYMLFIAIWDDELGAEVLDFCPKSSTGNLKTLSTDIFSTFEFFWKKSDETRKKTKTTLPIINLNKKARIVLDTLYNPDIGGFQSFVVVLLVPNYFSDQKIEVFDSVLLKISKKYINDRILLVKESYKDVEEIYNKEQEDEETSFEISDLYSFTAALDDFKAGVQLFQSRNFDDAYPLLRKALMKFEKEQNNNLILEALYLIASLFAQKKEFNIAEDYFRRLEALAEKMNHKKYGEISIFMTGFCSYKNERYIDAINQFLKIELFKKQFINEFQYYTFFGRALASLQNHEEAIKKLSFALRIIESQEQTPPTKKHKGQITHELGQLYYKQTLEKIKQFGVKNKESYQVVLDNAID